MTTISTILLFFVGFQSSYGQFGGGFGGGFGGFGGGFGGYGCGSYVPTLGYECYQPETGKATVACASKYQFVYSTVFWFKRFMMLLTLIHTYLFCVF